MAKVTEGEILAHLVDLTNRNKLIWTGLVSDAEQDEFEARTSSFRLLANEFHGGDEELNGCYVGIFADPRLNEPESEWSSSSAEVAHLIAAIRAQHERDPKLRAESRKEAGQWLEDAFQIAAA